MTCPACTKTKPIPVCTQSLVLGTIESHSTAVYINVDNLTLDAHKRFNATSSASGVVSLDMAGCPLFFAEGMAYELSVEKTDGTIQDITVGGVAYECISPVFERWSDADGAAVASETWTIQMDI